MHVQEMYRRLTGLVVFRRLLQDPVVEKQNRRQQRN